MYVQNTMKQDMLDSSLRTCWLDYGRTLDMRWTYAGQTMGMHGRAWDAMGTPWATRCGHTMEGNGCVMECNAMHCGASPAMTHCVAYCNGQRHHTTQCVATHCYVSQCSALLCIALRERCATYHCMSPTCNIMTCHKKVTQCTRTCAPPKNA